MTETEKIIIEGSQAIETNRMKVLHEDLTDIGLKRMEFEFNGETSIWYERQLVPGSKNFDAVVICFDPEIYEFFLQPYDHIRFTDIEKVEKLISAFSGAKIKD
jgi:hypothetical protein